MTNTLNLIENTFKKSSGLVSYVPVVCVVVLAVCFLILIAFALLRLLQWRATLRQETIFLEVTPPITANKTPHETKEFFDVLHGIGLARSAGELLFNKQFVASFEVSSTKDQGIRYIIGVPVGAETLVRQALNAHINDARIRRIDDHLIQDLSNKQNEVLEFRQRRTYYLPLKTQDSFLDHDSMAYLTSVMTELANDENVTFQAIVSPAEIAGARTTAARLRRNENMISGHTKSSLPKALWLPVRLASKLASEILHFVVDVATSSPNGQHNQIDTHNQQARADIKPARSITPHEQEVNEAINAKVHLKLFRVEIRALIVSDDSNSIKLHTKALRGTLASFDTQYQRLRPRFNFSVLINRYRLFVFRKRLPSLFRRHSSIFSAEEVGNLYHFPAPGTNTESLVQSLSRTLPATLSLKRGDNIDVVIGVNHHQGRETLIGLSAAERARHVYMIGSTGNGKTTLMKYAIVQDILSGKGVAILDPHGDMARDLLQFIPEERINDVIYFDPDDLEYSVGINMLEIDPSLKGDDLEREKYLVTEYTVEIFRKLFSDDDSGGSRIEAVLRNAIYTAFTTENPTLFTIHRLITDKKYRQKVVAKLDDEVLKNFWTNEFDAGGEYQRVKMGFGVTTKIGRFLTAVFVRRVMDTPHSTIDFDDIINSGKILICRLSKGDLVKDTSSLFGTTILARLQIAGQKRGKMREKDRKPFYIYIDEFQNFATTTFTEMLAEARKYGLHLFMAEQSTSQQDKDITNNILNNANTVICFSTGNPVDEQLLIPRFQPSIGIGEIQNLPSYNFYARIKSVGTDSQLPISGKTIELSDEVDLEQEARVVAASRANYARKYEPETLTPPVESAQNVESINVTNPTEEPV